MRDRVLAAALFLITIPAVSGPARGADAAGNLTFDEALAQILARSTTVATQQAAAGAQTARDLPLRLAFAPSLSFNANQKRTGGESVTSYNTRQLEGVAQLNLFRWGADYENWRAASADESNQQWLVEDAYLRTQDNAIDTLLLYVQRLQEVGVNESIVRMRTDSEAIARKRYDGGYLPLQELQKVSVDLANAESRLADARVASALATASLDNLLGSTRVVAEWPWQARLSALPQTPKVAAAPAGDDDGAQLAALLAQRPDWRAAQARVDAEGARLSRGWRLLGPSLDGQFSYGYYYNEQSSPSYQSGAFGGTQWQGVVSVTLPFFDHLAIYSDARAQAFVKSQAEIALEQVRRDARSEWEGARVAFLTSLASAQVRDRTLMLSRRLYQDSQARLRVGRISADDLVIEQTRLYDAELLSVQGWSAAHQAYSRLCRARGLRLADCRME